MQIRVVYDVASPRAGVRGLEAADSFPLPRRIFRIAPCMSSGMTGESRVVGAGSADCRCGAGWRRFLSLDRRVEEWPAELQALAPKIAGRWRCQDLQVSAPGHYLSAGHAPGSAWLLRQAVVCACTTDADWQAIVTANGQATIAVRTAGGGRQVFFGCGIRSIAKTCLDMAAAMMACFGAQSSGRLPSRCRLAQCRHI